MTMEAFKRIGEDMQKWQGQWNPEYKIKRCGDDLYYIEVNGDCYTFALPIEVIYGKIYKIYKEFPNRGNFSFEL